MKMRPDGSLQSSNTPTHDNIGRFREDYNLYRCMVTKVYYADDINNVTKNAQNPEVLYDVVVLGGFRSGQPISNCRLASFLGGNSNYWERTLKAASQPLSDTRLSDQDGDIVYVMFIQGHKAYPVIIACGNGIDDENAATSITGPRDRKVYNGITEQIDKNGNWSLNQAGGSTISVSKSDTVTIKTAGGAQITVNGSGDNITVKDKEGATLKISGGKVALGTSALELVDALSQTLELLATDLANLGYPLANAPQYAALKVKVDSIKGSV
jgi:hypothetical protein